MGRARLRSSSRLRPPSREALRRDLDEARRAEAGRRLVGEASPKFAGPSGERTRATYLYCVVRRATTPPMGRIPSGLPGATRPAVVAAGRSLWLIVSEVPLDLYGPERLETALRDFDWVAKVAVAHEAVTEHFARLRNTAVIPMKLFTMFSTEERAAAAMRDRRTDIEAVVKRIAGCEEWGVRVTRDKMVDTPRPVVEARSGTAFLAARKQIRDRARATAEKAAGAAATVFKELSPLARDARRRDDSPAGAVPPLLDAAFLVPSSRREKFRVAARRAAKACAGAGAHMTLTGPWPAYNFIETPGDRA